MTNLNVLLVTRTTPENARNPIMLQLLIRELTKCVPSAIKLLINIRPRQVRKASPNV